MKGKKIDNDFVSQFITNCVSDGISNIKDILIKAEEELNEVDLQIQNINNLKEKRIKLHDVVFSLKDKNEPKSDNGFIKYFSLSNYKYVNDICNRLQDKMFLYTLYLDKNILDEMVKLKIIKLENDIILKGTNFKEFLKFGKRFYD